MKKVIKGMCVSLTLISSLIMTAIVVLNGKMPEQFSVVEGSALQLDGNLEVSDQKLPSGRTVETASLSAGSTYTASLKLFGVFPVKEVAVRVVDLPLVVPCGTPFGIKMFTDGVLVVGMSDVDTGSGARNPAKSAGIKIGDVIVSINKTPVNTTEDVAQLVEKSGGKTMQFHIRRDNIAFDVSFTPVKSLTENRWKAGLWVRDSSAGIGTLTFYNPDSKIFGGLGHAVCDVDTGEALPLSSGEIVPARIYSVNKGVSGQPGELRGGFETGSLGNLTTNGETGIYGTLSKLPTRAEAIPVCMKQQVKTGYAQVMATIDGVTPALYDIRIDQVRYNDSSPTRNMVIIITDKRLLEKTGGIVQGMSGSPIIQDGKLAGAVTHVFVNDPTKGFAIFAENMLKTAEGVKTEEASSKPAA